MTAWPAETTCPGSPSVSMTVPSASATRTEQVASILGDPRVGFGSWRAARRPYRMRPSPAHSAVGSPSVADQLEYRLLIGCRSERRRARCGNSVPLGRQRKAKIGFVDPHQRLPGFDLLTNIHQPFDDLAGDAKAKIAFDLAPTLPVKPRRIRSPAPRSPG